MSGLVVVIGGTEDDAAALLPAYRGSRIQTASTKHAAAAVQNHEHEPPFTQASLILENGTLKALHGCEYAFAEVRIDADGTVSAQRTGERSLYLHPAGYSTDPVVTSLDHEQLKRQLLSPHDRGTRTIWKGVTRVPARHPAVANHTVDPHEAAATIKDLLAQAVRRRMTKNMPLLLSGGIDSASIAAVAAPLHEQLYGAPLATLTATYPNHPSIDERRYVDTLAATLPLRTHFTEPKPQRITRLPDPDTPVMAANFAGVVDAAAALHPGGFLVGEAGDLLLGTGPHTLEALMKNPVIALKFLRFLKARTGRSWPRVIKSRLPQKHKPIPWLKHPTQPVPHWHAYRRLAFSDLMAFAAEGLERVAQTKNMMPLDPYMDEDLWRYAASLSPATLMFDGRVKALGRLIAPDAVKDRADKTRFDALVQTDDLAKELAEAPKVLDWVDWNLLNETIETQDFALVMRVLSADRLAAEHP